jgi:hypothetical protein
MPSGGTIRATVAALVAFGIVVAAVALPEMAATARTQPTLSLSTSIADPGQSVGLTGTHWPLHVILQASVCGGFALLGHPECDLERSITFGPADDGVVQTSIAVGIPPQPCPCVVLVTQVDPPASLQMQLPITIVGAPSAPAPAAPPPFQPAVTVLWARVQSDNSWTAWFGAAAARKLVVRVRNTGESVIRPLLAARWVGGGTSHVIDSPRARVLPVGRTLTLTAPFALSTFAWGHQQVIGQVQGTTFDTNFYAGTSAYPWGLIVLAVVAVLALLALLATSIRKRRRGRRQEPRSEPEPTPRADDATQAALPAQELSQTGAET